MIHKVNEHYLEKHSLPLLLRLLRGRAYNYFELNLRLAISNFLKMYIVFASIPALTIELAEVIRGSNHSETI